MAAGARRRDPGRARPDRRGRGDRRRRVRRGRSAAACAAHARAPGACAACTARAWDPRRWRASTPRASTGSRGSPARSSPSRGASTWPSCGPVATRSATSPCRRARRPRSREPCATSSAPARLVGARPDLENIATLIDPPASTLDEWAHRRRPRGERLRPAARLAQPLRERGELRPRPVGRSWPGCPSGACARSTSPAGGCSTLHSRTSRRACSTTTSTPSPIPSSSCSPKVAARATGPLTVVLERDGAWPPFEELLAEIDAARAAVRARARASTPRRCGAGPADHGVTAGDLAASC